MPTEEVTYFSTRDAQKILSVINQLQASGWLVGGQLVLPASSPYVKPTYFRNDSGETIPPFSVMQITGAEEIGGQNYVVVDKYDETKFGGFLFNGDREVLDDDLGIAQPGPVYRMQGDGSTVTTGHLWGPVDDEWTVADNGGPWVVMGEDDVLDDVIVAQPDVAATYAAKVTTAITAASGSTLGTGVVTIRTIGSALADGQTGITVVSRFGAAMSVDDKVVVGRTNNGKLQLLERDC